MHNMTNTVTYLTDTNHDPHTHYILDEHDQRMDIFLRFWFEGEDVLPGDEIADFREALIRAAMRLNGEDREFLAANGFIVHEISLEPDDSDSLHIYYMFLTRTEGYDSHKAVLSECEKRGITPGYADIHKTLAVMEFLQCGTYKLIR